MKTKPNILILLLLGGLMPGFGLLVLVLQARLGRFVSLSFSNPNYYLCQLTWLIPAALYLVCLSLIGYFFAKKRYSPWNKFWFFLIPVAAIFLAVLDVSGSTFINVVLFGMIFPFQTAVIWLTHFSQSLWYQASVPHLFGAALCVLAFFVGERCVLRRERSAP